MAELKISEANKEDVAIWKNLQRYPAWKRICRELEADIKEAEKIINTIGFDSNKMFSQRDVAIIKRNAILDLINFPENQISLLVGTGTDTVENPDPYANAEIDPPNDDDL